jgi:DNA ligase (NAD+)
MTPTAQEVTALNDLLHRARKAYYVDHSPIMSDRDFDLKEKELKDLVRDNPSLASLAPELKAVGSDLTDGGRVKHAVPMKSIENHYTEEDYVSWYDAQALDGNGVMVSEPKYDGISCSILYENGRMIRALTRGDGESGEDITAAVRATGNIPVTLPSGRSLEVRGELVMKNSTLARINDEATKAGQKTYASTRNLTAGTMKQKNLDNVPDRDIQIRPWDALGDNLPASRLERLRLLSKEGFAEPRSVLVSDRDKILPTLRDLLEKNKTSDIAADGVVMKIDDVPSCQALGVSSNYTNYQICFKPQNDKGITYLRGVNWFVGRSGKITPVGIVDPITLAGAVITNVNLNNITWIREMGLKINSRISLIRSGGVIPVVDKVLDENEDL